MLKIRLRRTGARHQPSYRIVVADSRAPRDGVFVDQVGHYDPMTDPSEIKINEELALKWLRQGAQPSERVEDMLKKLGIMDKVKETA